MNNLNLMAELVQKYNSVYSERLRTDPGLSEHIFFQGDRKIWALIEAQRVRNEERHFFQSECAPARSDLAQTQRFSKEKLP